MNLFEIFELVQDDMEQVNQSLILQTRSDIKLINEVSTYIISSGGKRIRPILALLFAKLLRLEHSEQAIKIATIVELIHTATILHDDVVDESSLRRGKPTANIQFNNPAAVLVGDFVYTRAFQLISEFNNTELMKLFTDAVNVISEGEVKQLVNLGDVEITEQKYLDVIYSKTARLFEVCCHAIAMLKYPGDTAKQLRLAKYGTYLGTGFQIVDDIIDYKSLDEESGKHRGDDLAEGKPTLPIIRLKEVGTEADKNLVTRIIRQEIGREVLDELVNRLDATDCFDYCHQVAQIEADKAKQAIAEVPDSEVKTALLSLVDISIERVY